jgi:hypothetical protein
MSQAYKYSVYCVWYCVAAKQENGVAVVNADIGCRPRGLSAVYSIISDKCWNGDIHYLCKHINVCSTCLSIIQNYSIDYLTSLLFRETNDTISSNEASYEVNVAIVTLFCYWKCYLIVNVCEMSSLISDSQPILYILFCG